MGLFGQIQGPIRQVLDELFADTELSCQITYKKWISQSFDDDVGRNVTVYTSYPLTAIQLRHNLESVQSSESDLQVGDFLYMLKGDEVPEGMSLKDIVVTASGNEQKLKAIDDIFGLATSITIEGV